jgi:hypothetical protein
VSRLVAAGALSGLRLGISVSDSPDLGRLGLLEAHLRLALGEVTRAALVGGCDLAYGGNLDPAGYTTFLMSELQRYGRRDRPLLVCLAWPEHRGLPLSTLTVTRRQLGLYGRIVCLDESGNEVEPAAGREEAPQEPGGDVAAALTNLRRFMTGVTDARVLIGGRRSGFAGSMPGVLEEARFTIEAQKPVYLAGGFGGMTSDIVDTLRILPEAWIPSAADRSEMDPGTWRSLDELAAVAQAAGWTSKANGLTPEENRRLAVTHRASEIASLVILGLGRYRG